MQTANALVAYCVGLAAYSGIKVLVPAFYAMGDTKTPVKASFLALFVNVGLGYGLMQLWGHIGLALAIGLTSIFNFVQLWWWLRGRIGPLPLGRLASTGLRTMLASVIMGGVLYAGVIGLRPYWESSIPIQIALITVSIPLGAVLVLWLYGVFRVEEREELLQSARSLFGRFGVGR